MDWLFALNMAWIFTHELDAVHNHEWRVLPLTSWLQESTAYQVFVWLHVPLFAVLILIASDETFQAGFDMFLIAHAGLHWGFRHHPKYEFGSWVSNWLIFGGIPLGVLHLWVLWG